MIYKDSDRIDEYMVDALEHIQDRPGLRALFNKVSLIDELYTHVAGVAKLGIQLSLDVGLGDADIKEVALAGLLHDAGKIYVPRSILFKPGRLTDEEFAVIKGHPLNGYMACRELVSPAVLKMILNHHRKTDGSGYPVEDACKAGFPDGTFDLDTKCRIITVADIFSALVEPRLYHREKSVCDALEFVATFSGVDQDLVSRLHRLVRPEGC